MDIWESSEIYFEFIFAVNAQSAPRLVQVRRNAGSAWGTQEALWIVLGMGNTPRGRVLGTLRSDYANEQQLSPAECNRSRTFCVTL